MHLESFSRNAADLIRLRRAIYGPEDAQALMMGCFRRSKAGRTINERTVLTVWSELDAEANAMLERLGAGVL